MALNADTEACWVPLKNDDTKHLMRVADTVHPGLPEREEVFRERRDLFPSGCHALYRDDEFCGYVISHPIRRYQPPALDTLLVEIASDADQYYIHDFAIVPELRGKGYAQACMEKILAVAGGYATTSLISVYGTGQFWERHGFSRVQVDSTLAEKLKHYGEDAVYMERQNIKAHT